MSRILGPMQVIELIVDRILGPMLTHCGKMRSNAHIDKCASLLKKARILVKVHMQTTLPNAHSKGELVNIVIAFIFIIIIIIFLLSSVIAIMV